MSKLFFYVAFLVSFCGTIFGQFGSSGSTNPVSTGMGNTGNASSTGIYSIGINPANLMQSEDKHFEFNSIFPLPEIRVQAGTSFFTFKDLNYYFGGVDGNARYLTEKDKQDFKDLFKGGGSIFFDFGYNLLTASYKVSPEIGSFAFSIRDAGGIDMVIPEAIPDLLFTGSVLNKDYVFNQSKLQSSFMRYYSLSYAREFKEFQQTFFDKIAAGFTVKLVHGYYYSGADRFETNLKLSDRAEITGKADMVLHSAFSDNFGVKYDFDSTKNLKGSPSLFPSPAGTGLGFDIGFSALYKSNMLFSIAITDIGTVKWDKNAAEYVASANIDFNDLTDSKQLDSLSDQLKGKGRYISSFTSKLPTALRLGFAYFLDEQENPIPGRLKVNADFNQGFNNSPGNSVIGRFSFGAEWKPMDWVPYIRTGFSFGGINKFGWAFGLGFNTKVLQIDIATSDMGAAFNPNTSKTVSFSCGARWQF